MYCVSVQVSPTFHKTPRASLLKKKFGLRVFIGNWGICVCVTVTSEMTFDSGEVCFYMGSENKTKRL